MDTARELSKEFSIEISSFQPQPEEDVDRPDTRPHDTLKSRCNNC